MMTMKNVFLLTLALPAAFAFAPVSIPSNNALLLKTTSLQMSSNPFDALKNMFSPPQVEEIKPEPLPDVIINPDFTLAGIFLAAGLLLDTIPYIQLTLGPIITLLGILFAVQATRVRFVFDETSFELKIGNDLNDAGENFVVGGENRWTYDSFVNWEVSYDKLHNETQRT